MYVTLHYTYKSKCTVITEPTNMIAPTNYFTQYVLMYHDTLFKPDFFIPYIVIFIIA